MEHTKEHPLRVFEAFAGYGSQCMALRRLASDFHGFAFEVVGISEIDKHAVRSYMAVHGDTPNYGDISLIDWQAVPDFDLLTYSFPCTDISIAGQQRGLGEGSGTRSGLLWECRKAILAKRPRFLLMENVKALTHRKFMPDFRKWQDWLAEQGYTNHWQVLNAKDYGVPQNRERVFMASFLHDSAPFTFPDKMPLTRHLCDVLEPHVDEKYYLKDERVEEILTKLSGHGKKQET